MDHRQHFQRKTNDLNGFETFVPHFSSEFLVLAFICSCFHNQRTYCYVLLLTFKQQI